MMQIKIPIKPKPAPRPRLGRYGVYNLQSYTDYKDDLRQYFNCIDIIDNQPIFLDVTFYMPFPKSYTKKQRMTLLGKHCIIKPDIDNLVKGVMDAMLGCVYHDDNIVAEIKAYKIWSEVGSIDIQLSLL